MNISWIFGCRPASPFARIAAQERHQILRECEQALSPANVKLLRLRYTHNLNYSQIAVATGSTEDAIAQMHGRVLDKMLDELNRRNIFTKDHI